MKEKIHFTKMQGCGNDYIYVDTSLYNIEDPSAAAIAWSDRHKGVGSDGLVLIGRSPMPEADYTMRIFNADGSEAQMCGNAVRCVGKYLYESGICSRPRLFVETLSGIRLLMLQVLDGTVGSVTVNMGMPAIRSDVLMKGTDPIGFTSVNMGNPHAVFFRETVIPDEELAVVGRRVGTHPHFPEGTNVEFVRVRSNKELDVRVWERGSGITLACGTGACAAAVSAMWHGLTERNIIVHLPGGDLEVRWEKNTQSVYMTGPATEVFRGTYTWEDKR